MAVWHTKVNRFWKGSTKELLRCVANKIARQSAQLILLTAYREGENILAIWAK
jgi:hypothetical protein